MGRTGQRGFTLVEIVVVVAIIAVLVGMMVPFLYRVFESSERELTRQRMRDLKNAMAGDRSLVQNGIRTHYGFAGDCAQLPRAVVHPQFAGQYALSGDLINPGMGLYPSTCSGPYMPAGYDPNAYNKDAWGNEFVYTPFLASDGSNRRGSATLKSAGPDGQFGTADDLNDSSDPDLQISETEIFPTSLAEGNLNYVFIKAADDPGPVYSATLRATYIGPFSGNTHTFSGCITPVTVGPVTANEPKPVTHTFSAGFGVRLPIGKVLIKSYLYDDTLCSGTATESPSAMSVFVSDGIKAVYLNAPSIHYTIP